MLLEGSWLPASSSSDGTSNIGESSMTACDIEVDPKPAGSVRLRAGEEWARPLSCFQLVVRCSSAAVVEADRTLFLEVV
jgi:hypothetical protein